MCTYHTLFIETMFGVPFFCHEQNLITIQKQAIRLVNNIPIDYHTNDLFYHYKLLKLENVNRFFLGVYVFNNSNKFSLILSRHNYNTRKQNDLANANQRLALTQHSILFVAPETGIKSQSVLRYPKVYIGLNECINIFFFRAIFNILLSEKWIFITFQMG